MIKHRLWLVFVIFVTSDVVFLQWGLWYWQIKDTGWFHLCFLCAALYTLLMGPGGNYVKCTKNIMKQASLVLILIFISCSWMDFVMVLLAPPMTPHGVIQTVHQTDIY